MGIAFIPIEVRYYQNAIKYDMDNLNSLQELVEKYPETIEKLTKIAMVKLEKNTGREDGSDGQEE